MRSGLRGDRGDGCGLNLELLFRQIRARQIRARQIRRGCSGDDCPQSAERLYGGECVVWQFEVEALFYCCLKLYAAKTVEAQIFCEAQVIVAAWGAFSCDFGDEIEQEILSRLRRVPI